MPNLINDNGYNGLGGLAQNYRRVRTGDSNFGTRRIQFYEITVYGLTDQFITDLEEAPSRTINPDFNGWIDQNDTTEYTTATILEAILRGVQKMSEVYIVGLWDYNNEDPDYNDLQITIGVSADTVDSGWEQYWNGNQNNNSEWIEDAVYDAVDEFDPAGGYDYIDVIPVQLIGDYTDPVGPFALGRNNPAVSAMRAAKKAARLAARTTPPQFKKPK